MAKTSELLIYNERKLSFQEEPLEAYLQHHEIEDAFLSYSSENERGYIGIWEIVNNRLKLVELKGFDHNMKMVGIEDLFQDPDHVFASWYSGEINIFIDHSFDPKKRDLKKRRLIFEDGVLVDYIDLEL
ncbi:MAG: hypothetical protein ACJASF_001927 [Vicingaceae bacterium]|jgi:hypothetical protein